MSRQRITARILAKCEARKRTARYRFATFDSLSKECRDAHRELPSWSNYQLQKCFGRACQHKTS